jgi:hypothetical protein
MAEIGIVILLIGVLLTTQPARLQALLDRLREFSRWLGE